ncbi:MAG: DUF2283 domain-containing protein [Rhodospirillaceae bacterium]
MIKKYHDKTDSLYVVIRDIPAVDTVEYMEDVMVDLGDDGMAVGYDIQFSSDHKDIIDMIERGEMKYYPKQTMSQVQFGVR